MLERLRLVLATTLTLLVIVLAPSVRLAASLGGDVNSVQTDRVRMQGALVQVTSSGPYAVHEMRAASGTTVREFVSSAGTVFGVAWQGPSVPDLRQLLGTYFEPYMQAAQAAQKARSGHGPLVIEQPGFVVERSGHARAFAGRAYVPQLLPAGVLPDVVR